MHSSRGEGQAETMTTQTNKLHGRGYSFAECGR